MTALRWVVTAGLVGLALVVQVTLFPHVAWHGVVPNLCLLLVVAAALVRGPESAAMLGFATGLMLDLAPPADHVAGRWALALVLVGYVAGRMRPETGARVDARTPTLAVVGTVAAASFVGTSVYALTGLVLQDPAVGVGELLPVVLVSVGFDVLLTPFVLPLALRLFVALEPARAPG